jgi:hypothetical protein
VVAHASYLLSFKPFHTNSWPPSTPQQPRAAAPPLTARANSPGRYNALDSTRGLALVPRPDSLAHRCCIKGSLPHTLTTSAALTTDGLTTAYCLHTLCTLPLILVDRQTNALSSPSNPRRPAFRLKFSPPSSLALPTNAVLARTRPHLLDSHLLSSTT